jgi:uncharacterized protein YkwD
MRISGIVAGFALAISAAPAASAACPGADARPTAATLDEARAALVCLHNEERRASGVPRLRANRVLAGTATAHAEDMVARHYFAYDTPEGADPFERLRGAGYIRRGFTWNAGENIAWATGDLATPRSIFSAWMERTGSRLTLLASDFRAVGVGIALGAPSLEHGELTSAVTYTVDFGKRRARKR